VPVQDNLKVVTSVPRKDAVPFPPQIEELLNKDPLLAPLPRDTRHIIVQKNGKGVVMVYAVVTIPRGTTAWGLFTRHAKGVEHTQYAEIKKKSKYMGFLSLLYTLNTDGVARNVAHRGWKALQVGETKVPLIVGHTSSIPAILTWYHAT
jgi:hypothetical protein